jgi:chromosome segregation ATPase
MGLFRRRRAEARAEPTAPQPLPPLAPAVDDTSNETIEALRTELSSLRERVDGVDAAKDRLDERVRSIDDRLSTPISAPPAPPAPPGPPAGSVDPNDIHLLRAQMARLVERIDALDHRITTVSTELANQIGELGTEMEALSERDHGDAAASEALTRLEESQTRLANEQARYQIAFRQDLAELAERVRRPGS